jgi:nitrite reductase (NADH) large subunit
MSRVMALPDTAEICGCNGVCKGDIIKAVREKKLFTLDEVRAHTKASGSCGSCTGLVETILAATAGGDYSTAPSKKPLCNCTEHTHDEIRAAIVEQGFKTTRKPCAAWPGKPRRLHQMPPGAELLPALRLADRVRR